MYRKIFWKQMRTYTWWRNKEFGLNIHQWHWWPLLSSCNLNKGQPRKSIKHEEIVDRKQKQRCVICTLPLMQLFQTLCISRLSYNKSSQDNQIHRDCLNELDWKFTHASFGLFSNGLIWTKIKQENINLSSTCHDKAEICM